MAANWLLKGNLIEPSQRTFHLHLELATGNRHENGPDSLPRPAYRSRAALRMQKALPLLAAFAAVSVVVLFVYLCSLFIRRRVATFSFGRKLAASPDGQESDASESCVADTDSVPGAHQDTHSPPSPGSRVPLSAGSVQADSDSSPLLGKTAAISSKRLSSAARLELEVTGDGRGMKRKKREISLQEREAKLFRLSPPILETPPGPPPPPLDPDLDLLIDSVLAESGYAFFESSWPLDDEQKYLTSSALQSEHALSMEDSGGQITAPALKPANQIYPGLPGDPYPGDSGDLAGTTSLTFFGPALTEPSHSAQGLSADDWLQGEVPGAGDMLRVTASSWLPSTLPGSSEEPEEATKSHRPSSAARSEGRRDSFGLSSSEASQGDSPGELVQQSAGVSLRVPSAGPSTVSVHGMAARAPESSIVGSLLPSAFNIAAPYSSATTAERLPPTVPSTVSVHGMAVSEPESSIVRSLLSSTSNIATPSSSTTTTERVHSTDPATVSAGAPESNILRSLLSSTSNIATPSSSGTTVVGLLRKWRLSEQLAFAQAESATENLEASFKWVKEAVDGVSDEVLLTHPFYHHPGVQLRFSKRTFSQEIAARFRRKKQKVVRVLSECRQLLKMQWFTGEDFERLLYYTERLYGYATSIMPVDNRAKSAVEALGRVFLVLDTLHCAAEALGDCSKVDTWWPMVVRHIERAGYRRNSKEAIVGKNSWSYPILSALRVALEYYRMRQRPPLRLVVSLKIALFLSPMSSFNKRKWDAWREDATEWVESIKKHGSQ